MLNTMSAKQVERKWTELWLAQSAWNLRSCVWIEIKQCFLLLLSSIVDIREFRLIAQVPAHSCALYYMHVFTNDIGGFPGVARRCELCARGLPGVMESRIITMFNWCAFLLSRIANLQCKCWFQMVPTKRQASRGFCERLHALLSFDVDECIYAIFFDCQLYQWYDKKFACLGPRFLRQEN